MTTRFLPYLPLAFAIVGPAAEAQQSAAHAPLFITTPDHLVTEMLSLGEVSAGDIVYDLGSGDGRLVIGAAQLGARAIGIEYEEWLVEKSRALADSAGVAGRTTFVHGDIFEADYADADVVLMYLGHAFNQRLRPRLLSELRPGTRVVSHAFHMEDWTPDETREIGSGSARATLHLWIVPAVADGFWSLRVDGMESMNLEFRQRFQMLVGEARSRETPTLVENGRMTGEEIHFEMLQRIGGMDRRLVFTGRLQDGRLSGTVAGPAEFGTRQWQALRYSDPLMAPT